MRGIQLSTILLQTILPNFVRPLASLHIRRYRRFSKLSRGQNLKEYHTFTKCNDQFFKPRFVSTHLIGTYTSDRGGRNCSCWDRSHDLVPGDRDAWHESATRRLSGGPSVPVTFHVEATNDCCSPKISGIMKNGQLELAAQECHTSISQPSTLSQASCRPFSLALTCKAVTNIPE